MEKSFLALLAMVTTMLCGQSLANGDSSLVNIDSDLLGKRVSFLDAIFQAKTSKINLYVEITDARPIATVQFNTSPMTIQDYANALSSQTGLNCLIQDGSIFLFDPELRKPGIKNPLDTVLHNIHVTDLSLPKAVNFIDDQAGVGVTTLTIFNHYPKITISLNNITMRDALIQMGKVGNVKGWYAIVYLNSEKPSAALNW